MSRQNASNVFLPLPGGEQATYTNQTIRFRHYDWLGSARFESNMSEQEYGDVAYAPFGEKYSIRNTPYLSFTGQQQDTISGLYDFLYREYNPTQGRWISPDPAGFQAADPSNPQSWNRYAYVVNNPLSGVDADGLQGPPPPCVLGGKTTPNGLWPFLVGENPNTTGDADAPPPCNLDWALSSNTYFNTRNRQSVLQDEANYVQNVNQAWSTPPPGIWDPAGPGHPGCFIDKGRDALWCPGPLAPHAVGANNCQPPFLCNTGTGPQKTIGPPKPPPPLPHVPLPICMTAAVIGHTLTSAPKAGVTLAINLAPFARPAVASLLPGPGWLYAATAVLYDGSILGLSYLECKE